MLAQGLVPQALVITFLPFNDFNTLFVKPKTFRGYEDVSKQMNSTWDVSIEMFCGSWSPHKLKRVRACVRVCVRARVSLGRW